MKYYFPILIVINFDYILTFDPGQSSLCPVRGHKLQPSPEVLNIETNQNGYRSQIEIVDTSGHVNYVEEYFNGKQRIGSIKIHSEFKLNQQIFYYHESSESFILNDNGQCNSNDLDNVDRLQIINKWFPFSDLQSTLIGQKDQLGPVSLMIYASSVSLEAQFIERTLIENEKTLHWFHCVQRNETFVDFYFNEKSRLPVQLTLSFANKPDLNVTYNYISFEPIVIDPDQAISFPFGRGCDRTWNKYRKEVIPIFGQSSSYSLNMEAVITFTQPTRSALINFNLKQGQGLLSIDLNDGQKFSRFIRDTNNFIVYSINLASGKCSKTQINGTSQWPLEYDSYYRLLDSRLLSMSKVHFMGQIDTKDGRFDVFEKIEHNFFLPSSNNYVDSTVSLTYFFRHRIFSEQRNQAPDRILITPIKNQKSQEMLNISQIEIIIQNYNENENDLSFDLSQCYSQLNEYLWFQVSFSEYPELFYPSKEINKSQVITEFYSALSFITRTRIPEIHVTSKRHTIYVTCKLIEQPNFVYQFISHEQFTLSESNVHFISENGQDCAQLCNDDLTCSAFSYCSNMECSLVFSSNPNSFNLKPQSDCIVFTRKAKYSENRSKIDKNSMKSSKNLLHKIQRLIVQGDLDLHSLSLLAENLFIVGDQNSIGDLVSSDFSRLQNNFALSATNRRLNGQVNYNLDLSSCLTNCLVSSDCNYVSYCASKNGRCTAISSIDFQPSQTIYSDGCVIYSRSYKASFKENLGQRSQRPANVLSIHNHVDSEECAKSCLDSEKCDSFYYCSDENFGKDKSGQSTCYLYGSVNEKTIWIINSDYPAVNCKQYTRKYSSNYDELFGKVFKSNPNLPVISELQGESSENCAKLCWLSENCQSYEFCEPNVRNSVKSVCSLTTFNLSQIVSDQLVETSLYHCSVYLKSQQLTKSNIHFHGTFLKILLGLLTFLLSSIIGAGLTHLYFKKM